MNNVTRLGDSPFDIFNTVMDQADRSGFPVVGTVIRCIGVGCIVALEFSYTCGSVEMYALVGSPGAQMVQIPV